MEKIMNKGIGTNKAEAAAETLAKDCSAKGDETRNQLRKSFLQSIMNIKLKDSDKAFKVEDFKYHHQKKLVAKVINDINILIGKSILAKYLWTFEYFDWEKYSGKVPLDFQIF